MTDEQAQDLLNTTALAICPGLQLEFTSSRNHLCGVQVSYIWVQNSVAFGIEELSANKNPKQFTRLFKRRVERSLVDLRKKILEELRELRRK